MKILRDVRYITLAVVACLVSCDTSAQVTIGTGVHVDSGDGFQGIVFSGGIIQSFKATAPGQILSSLSLTVGEGQYSLYIGDWTDKSTSTGFAPVFNTILWQTNNSTSITRDIKTYSNIDIALDPVKTYAYALINESSTFSLFTVFMMDDEYADGSTYRTPARSITRNLWYSGNAAGKDHAFSMVLTEAPLTPVPEPTIPGLALGAGGLLSWIAYRAKRKQALIKPQLSA